MELQLLSMLLLEHNDIYSGLPSFLELRCSGGAGECHGSKMGVYQLVNGGGERGNQGPVYQQMHNTNDDRRYFLYR